MFNEKAATVQLHLKNYVNHTSADSKQFQTATRWLFDKLKPSTHTNALSLMVKQPHFSCILKNQVNHTSADSKEIQTATRRLFDILEPSTHTNALSLMAKQPHFSRILKIMSTTHQLTQNIFKQPHVGCLINLNLAPTQMLYV